MSGVGGRRGPGTSTALFVFCWVLFSAHFASNIVREHYPAFSLAERGTLRVDEYVGLHSDIFVHTDGHAYINNNVGSSVLAAVPLFLFDPVLDFLEAYAKQQQVRPGQGAAGEYDTKYPNRRKFYAEVTARGLHLRFGGAAAVTTAFLMAPLAALLVVCVYRVLRTRRVPDGRALGLALLFAFGTPWFFRSVHLNHNTLQAYAVFGSFLLLWDARPGPPRPATGVRAALAGLLAGYALFIDYSSVVPLFALFAYHVAGSVRERGWRRALLGAWPFVLGSVPPVLALLGTQWAQFGVPWLPAQAWMPEVHYTDRGWRGFSWPSADLLLRNLFDSAYGLFVFGPLLILGCWPGGAARGDEPILPRRERAFVWAFGLAFLLFCSANQYARMQWNTGFRYLIPLVPLLFLAASDRLARLPRWGLVLLAVPVVLNEWVLTMMREPVLESWRMFLHGGVQLTWVRVLGQTGWLGAPWLSSAIIATCLVPCSALLLHARRAEKQA